MMTVNFLCHYKKLILSILILGFTSSILFSQSDTVINKYARVISRSDYQVVVDDASDFNNGDYVLIIQMQGVAIDASDGPLYGRAANQLVGIPGRYEFLIIQTVTHATNTITFFAKINKYDPAGSVQIVKVPFFNTLNISKEITCKPWDRVTKTGGVVAMIVGNTLTLNNNIDVSGKGFTGGKDTIGLGECSSISGINLKYSFPRTFNNAGYKGEGLASFQSFCSDPCVPAALPLYLKGKGSLLTGGGGGNGKFSGGGGGSNRGQGGRGGKEFYLCSSPDAGGDPGISITGIGARLDTITGGIFMGGGGGASTSWAGSVSKAGGDGGGIVIIVTDRLIGNGNKIIADGKNVSTAKSDAGAGGGGAGGSVIISSNILSNVELSSKGGNGGNHLDDYGQGGGGGGGLIWISQPSTPTDVTNKLTGGQAGIDTILVTTNAQNGDPGLARYSFRAQLNGFLFNSVRSSVTETQTDSICSNITVPKITGTTPVGGTPDLGPGPDYIIKWEKSYDLNFTLPILLVNDPDPINYTPGIIETATVWYRRTVTDFSIPTPIVDVSRPVEIIVQPAITGNLVGKDTTICFNQNPLDLVALNAGPSNGSSHNYYLYKWIQNNTNSNWNTSPAASGNAILASYDPPALTATTYYQRVVTSGRCIDFSSSVKITVLNSITGNNIIKSDSIICQGSLFAALGASAPGQGEIGDYRYQWQDSVVTSLWNPAAGSNTGAVYTPDTSKFSVATQNRFYRRVVLSGPDDVCRSKSSPILLTKYPKIKNNLIPANLADLTICSGSAPVALPGSSPADGAGNGSYTFIWQQSPDGLVFSLAPGENNSTTGNYQAPALTDTTWYRRIVNSGVYKAAVVCTNTSLPVRINVHKPILNNNIALSGGGTLQTICNNQIPNPLQGTTPTGGTNIPGDFAYLWKYSTDNLTFNPIPGSITTFNYAPAELLVTTYYRRDATSGACTVSSNSIAVTVLPTITNNTLSGNPKVCFSRVPDLITGGALSGGSGTYKYFWEESTDGGTQWNSAAGANSLSNYQAPALFVPTRYRRYVTSGLNDCCTSMSDIFDVGIDPLPVSQIDAGPDTIIYSTQKIYHMKAVNPAPAGETGVWSVLDNGSSEPAEISNYKTLVSNLSVGTNSFLWTVSKGSCDLKDSINIVLLKDFEPEGFSPNGDAWNNTFIIEGLDENDNYLDLSIVNGAGTEVFSTSNRNGQKWTNWDGKNSKGLDLSEGTYYYMLKITPKNLTGSVIKKNGFIILKRY